MKRLVGLAAAAGLVFTVACAQTDAGITTSVKSKLAADDTVKAYQVDVDTSNYVVTLSGEVDTPAQRAEAVRIARETEGVRDVIDQLRVNPTAATSGRVDVDADGGFKAEVKEDTNAVADGAKKGAEAVKDGAKKIGSKITDAVTDDDRDSDRDGK